MKGNAPAVKEAHQNPRYLVIHDTDIAGKAEQAQLVDKSHWRRGYAPSSIINPATGTGWHIAYHYFIGKDGTVLQTRPDTDRTQHTSCGLGLTKCVSVPNVNDQSLAIVLAGDFMHEQPTGKQLAALRKLVADLDAKYHFERIMPHRDASPTSCPGDNLVTAIKDLIREPAPKDVWQVTRYYTPVQGQKRYYRTVSDEKLFDAVLTNGMVEKKDGDYWYNFAGPTTRIGTTTEDVYDWFRSHKDTMEAIRKELEYMADFKVNCSGDCLDPADPNKRYTEADAGKVAACPPEYPFGTRFEIEGMGVVTCHDHGSAIRKNHLDVWTGVGDAGLQRILTTEGGPRSVRVLQ